ncbi:hypothetical protein R7D66_05015 [Vibrio sp. Vb2354]|uniref:hypothetical protein n=1 Tax=unclassified Vibrio TaxID=2614977 RepID=UPI0029644378|nr:MULTISPECIES: hypothetical protein [unclassified Vibrio]MDW1737811.1 hypothetical protein [Vibrio sp. Vb2321]MDW1756933.1 hypothetical protein [Vibrio sp. Vb2353]MDW1771236.1 hypothetical protein [Vibrio sp. Vb2354]MDW1807560.1 hypothetical protein [Vibrio sp. Vb2362]
MFTVAIAYTLAFILVSLFYVVVINRFVINFSLNEINAYSFSLLYTCFIFVFPGVVIIASGYFSESPYSYLVSGDNKTLAAISVLASLVMFAIFSSLWCKLFGSIAMPYLKVEYKGESNAIKLFYNIIHYLAILLFVYVLYKMGGNVPLLSLISGDIKQAAIQRSEFRFGGSDLITNVFAANIIPLSCLLSYCRLKVSSNASSSVKFKLKFRFFFSFILTSLYLLIDTQKAPVLVLIISLILIRIYFSGFSWKYVFAALSIFSISVALYASTKSFGFEDMDYLIFRVLNRLFISSVGGLFVSFEVFPNIIDKGYILQGLPNILFSIFDADSVNSAKDVMIFINGDNPELGVQNSYYMAGGWASLNLLSFLVAPAVVSANFYLFHRLVALIPQNVFAFKLAFYFNFMLLLNFNADYRSFSYFLIFQVPVVILLFISFFYFSIKRFYVVFRKEK